MVKCHSEIDETDCCSEVWVNATKGPIADKHVALLGKYDQRGSYNGRPVYFLEQYGLEYYLYFRKMGNNLGIKKLLKSKMG